MKLLLLVVFVIVGTTCRGFVLSTKSRGEMISFDRARNSPTCSTRLTCVSAGMKDIVCSPVLRAPTTWLVHVDYCCIMEKIRSWLNLVFLALYVGRPWIMMSWMPSMCVIPLNYVVVFPRCMFPLKSVWFGVEVVGFRYSLLTFYSTQVAKLPLSTSRVCLFWSLFGFFIQEAVRCLNCVQSSRQQGDTGTAYRVLKNNRRQGQHRTQLAVKTN